MINFFILKLKIDEWKNLLTYYNKIDNNGNDSIIQGPSDITLFDHGQIKGKLCLPEEPFDDNKHEQN